MKNKKSLFLFELLIKTLFLIVVLPVSTMSFSLALKFSKYSYITLENILAFSGYWLSIIALIITVTFAAAFFYVEMICLFLFFQHSSQNQELSVSQIIYPGINKACQLMKQKKNRLLPLFCFASGIVYALPLYIGMIFRQRIPQYIFDSIMSKWYVVVIAIFVLAGMLIFVYYGLFALQHSCSSECSFWEAYKKSHMAAKGHHKQLIFTLLWTNLLLCIFYASVYLLVVVIAGLIIFFTMPDNLCSAAFLTVYDVINRYFGFVFGIIGVIANFYRVSQLYLQFSNYDKNRQLEYERLLRDIKYSQKTQKGMLRCKYTRWIGLISIVCLLFGGLYIATHINNPIIKAPLFGTYITSHRGYSSIAPENTLEALEAAIGAMSDYVEIDVQETKDGTVCLLHDTNLKRTTGRNQSIWNVTYEELEYYNAAYLMPKQYDFVKIPTFEEALILCKDRIYMNIEVKVNSHEQALVQKVVDLIVEYGMEDQCVITSTNYGALRQVKELNQDIKTGYIMSLAYGYFYNNDYADFFSVKSSFITKDMVQLAHSYGKEVHAWTVNQRAEIERMKQLGVDNIITDDPILVREIVYEDEWTHSFTEFLRTFIK